MSETTTPAADTTAIQPAKTIEDVMSLLRVGEHSAEGQEGHEKRPASTSVGWIGYRSNKSKAKLGELLAANVEENSFYLYDNGVIYPKPFYVHLMAGYHYYSKVDKDNNVVGVSAVLNPELRKQWYSDHYIALMLVRLPGATPMFKAATFGQRKAMVRAVDKLRDVVGGFEKDRQGREWTARGEKHRESFAAAKWPAFAVRARIWGKLEASRTEGADDYNLGLSAIEPTPIEDVRALNRYMGYEPETYGGENKKHGEYTAALAQFLRRRKEVVDQIARNGADEDGDETHGGHAV